MINDRSYAEVLLAQKRRDILTEGLPGRELPEVLAGLLLIWNQMHLPAQLPDPFALALIEAVIITPCLRVGLGADHMQVDGAIHFGQLILESFEASD